MTQTDLAGDRFSKEYVSQIERGKTRPTRETIEWLAAHGVTEVVLAELDLLSRAYGLEYIVEAGTIVHRYPICWRCKTPLLYYAKPSWYIRTTAKKQLLVENNQTIRWVPEHIKNGRFGNWLEGNVDWALSRERYWGTPLPIWVCDGCGDVEVLGSVAEPPFFGTRLDALTGRLAGFDEVVFTADVKVV